MSIQKIEEIEKKYPVEQIAYQNFQVWPFIRFSLWANYLSKVEPIRANPSNFTLSKKISFLRSSFYGLGNSFRRYRFLCFSDTSERKLIDGLYVDKSVDFILKILPQTLLIELPLPRHYSMSQVSSRYIISKIPLYAGEWLYEKLFLRKLKIHKKEIVDDILKELEIAFDYQAALRKNLAQYRMGKLLTKVYKPRGIIIQCAYTNTGFVKAFKDFGVKVVEVQHGLISSSHVAYNVFKKFDSSYFPDYFFSYGHREKLFFHKKNFYINSENVLPVGHYYLDIISSSTKKIADIVPEAVDYDSAVSITGQNLPEVEQKFIDFIKAAATECPRICFLYIPRNKQSAIYTNTVLPSNLKIISDRDTYEIIRLTSFHTTIYSTCAIEALALGTPNVLVNIDGLALEHYADILTQSKTTKFVNSVDEYLTELLSVSALDKKEVTALNSSLIETNYKENISKAIELIFK